MKVSSSTFGRIFGRRDIFGSFDETVAPLPSGCGLGELGYGKAFLQMLDLIFGWILKWQHLIVLIRADEAVQFG